MKKIFTAIFFLLIAKSLYAITCEQYGVFTEFNGHYYTTTKDRLTFGYAKTFAELANGYLAIPNSSEENEFLVSLILGNQFAWIGIEDPTLSNSYCYAGGACSYSDSRFKTVKNEALIYKNWASNQPDNLVKNGDTSVIPAITPLGEHWVALNSVNTKWYDFGNHADEYNNPVKFLAIYEFDTRPECFNDDNSSELIDLHCNTALSIQNGQTADSGQLLQCQKDANGTSFCPASLAACQNTQYTNDGYSQEHTGMQTTHQDAACPSGSNLPSSCIGTYTNTWLKQMYLDEFGRCPDQKGYDYWLGVISSKGYTSASQLRPEFCYAASKDWKTACGTTANATTCYGTSLQDTTVKQPTTTQTAASCPNGGTLASDGLTCNKTCSTVSSYYCPNGGTLSGSTCSKTCSGASYYCPNGGTLSGSTCSKTCSGTSTVQCPATYKYTNSLGTKFYNCPLYYTDKCKSTFWVNSASSCGSYSTTTTYDCSYSASTTSSSYDCSYNATANYTYYDCPYSATCSSGSNLPSDCSGNYTNTWLKQMYLDEFGRCPDQKGYDYWLGVISSKGYTSASQLRPEFCYAASKDWKTACGTTANATTCYGTSLQDTTVKQPTTTQTAASCPSGSNLPSSCIGTYTNTWLKQMYLDEFGRCPDQKGYDYWLGVISSKGYTSADQLRPAFCAAASVDWQTACGTTANQSQCYSSDPYLYYTYHCNADTNVYGESYIPQNAGGEGSTNSTPPTNNCVQQNYVCGSNPQQTCANVGGVWQCSEHPCVDANDIEHTDTEVGSMDGNDDGWNKQTGACNGQLYLFGGTSKACRSWDLFSNFVTGTAVVGTAGLVAALDDSNCCSNDAVFFGLISCSADEKLLAQKKRAGQCHEIGEFCSRKIKLGFAKICVQKKKSSCCFNSKLARMINEQGRPQLGKGWGTASNPECKGFTPEEFQKLDFSKIDMSEFVQDIKVQSTNFQDVGGFIKSKVEGFYVH